MPDIDRERAILRAVELYYYEGLTQSAISERLGRTRWTVGRLLKEASDSGMITVKVDHPRGRRRELEIKLQDAYGLRAVRVVPKMARHADSLAILVEAASDYFDDLRPRPRIISVASGRTTVGVLRELPDIPGVTVAQMCPAPKEADSPAPPRPRHGTVAAMPGRPYADTVAEANRMHKNPAIVGPLELSHRADVALFTPSDLDHESWLVQGGEISPTQLRLLRSRRAVATVANRPIDGDGHEVDSELSARTVGITFAGLRKAKTRVAVGCHKKQWPGFSAVLKAKLADVLVVDSDTAKYLLLRNA